MALRGLTGQEGGKIGSWEDVRFGGLEAESVFKRALWKGIILNFDYDSVV